MTSDSAVSHKEPAHRIHARRRDWYGWAFHLLCWPGLVVLAAGEFGWLPHWAVWVGQLAGIAAGLALLGMVKHHAWLQGFLARNALDRDKS